MHHYHKTLNFLLEGVKFSLDKEIAPDGSYLTYVPFGAMIERSQMTPYHKKLLHAAANKVTITITIINLGYKREELTLSNPC